MRRGGWQILQVGAGIGRAQGCGWLGSGQRESASWMWLADVSGESFHMLSLGVAIALLPCLPGQLLTPRVHTVFLAGGASGSGQAGADAGGGKEAGETGDQGVVGRRGSGDGGIDAERGQTKVGESGKG